MNRATMRGVLRRRLNEQTADNWDDTELNALLDESLFWVQKKIARVDPIAFMAWARTSLVANESFYNRPVGSWWEFEVAVKGNPSEPTYTPLARRPYKAIRALTSDQAETAYSKVGTFLAIFPPPPFNVTDGLQIVYAPLLTMAVDTDVPAVHPSLHTMIVVKANHLALQEQPESPQLRPVQDELADLDGDIMLVYGRSAVDGLDRLWIPAEALGRG